MIIRHDCIPSTNDEAMRLALEGAERFTAVVSDTQSAGRGRNGHTWTSPSGVGLYASLVLRPAVTVERVPVVTLVAGIAAAEAIAQLTGLHARLKWPNDVLINRHKVAGILCEGAFSKRGEDAIVIAGLGVNVNTQPQDLPERPLFPASSLLAESGRHHDRDVLLDLWIERARHWVDVLECGNIALIIERWKDLDALSGERLRVSLPDGRAVEGVECGTDEAGCLVLRLDDGTRFSVIAGDVKIAVG